MKWVIMNRKKHPRTVVIITIKRYMCIWHVCLVSRYLGEILQLTNWILDSISRCHITPEVSDFISGSLEDTYKYIEVTDGHYVA